MKVKQCQDCQMIAPEKWETCPRCGKPMEEVEVKTVEIHQTMRLLEVEV